MKNIYLLFLTGLLLFVSCSEEDIMVFDNTRQVYIAFSKLDNDCIRYSFAFEPNIENKTINIPISYAGRLLEKDELFKISVVNDSTTAPQSLYYFDEEQSFNSDTLISDFIVNLKPLPDNDNNEYRLRLKLMTSGIFEASLRDSTEIDIYFTNKLSRPAWWTEDISNAFFGDYSDKKLTLLSEITGIFDFSVLNESELRYYALELKEYLANRAAEGNPILEEDGNIMVVNVIG